MIEPAERQIETVFVDAPVLQSASILEVAEAVLVQFDRDTDMGGRSALAALPASLTGEAASVTLVQAVRSGGFPCSSTPAPISPATLSLAF